MSRLSTSSRALYGPLASNLEGVSRQVARQYRPTSSPILSQVKRNNFKSIQPFRCAPAGLSFSTQSLSSTSSSSSGSSSSTSNDTSESLSSGSSQDAGEASLRLEAPQPGSQQQKLAQIEPRLSLTFTCTANDCGHRSTHEFSKRAYTKGIVLVQCPECKNRHLIADHIGWFKESTEDGKLKTVEDLLRAKGETVRTGRVNYDGDIEFDPDSTPSTSSQAGKS